MKGIGMYRKKEEYFFGFDSVEIFASNCLAVMSLSDLKKGRADESITNKQITPPHMVVGHTAIPLIWLCVYAVITGSAEFDATTPRYAPRAPADIPITPSMRL